MGRCYMGEHQDHRPHAHPSVKCAQSRKHAADSPRIKPWLQRHRDDVRFIIGPARALKSLKPYHSNQPRQIGALVHAVVLLPSHNLGVMQLTHPQTTINGDGAALGLKKLSAAPSSFVNRPTINRKETWPITSPTSVWSSTWQTKPNRRMPPTWPIKPVSRNRWMNHHPNQAEQMMATAPNRIQVRQRGSANLRRRWRSPANLLCCKLIRLLARPNAACPTSPSASAGSPPHSGVSLGR